MPFHTNIGCKKPLFAMLLATLLSGVSLQAVAAQYYGAIAMNKYNGRTGYSINHTSVEAAELNAVDRCGGNCKSMLWFRNGCGAIAFGSNGRYGTAIGPTRASAENKAVEACGLGSCVAKSWACTRR